MKGKAFKSIGLVVSIMLVIAGGKFSSAQEIPWERPTSLPDYIGAPAKAHPTANSAVPQDPFLAPNPFAHSHSDAWMSDTVDVAGPLGRNPVTLSTTMPEAHQNPNSWLIPCGSMGFDRQGRPIINCYGMDEAAVVMLDPDTLEVLTHYPLKVRKDLPSLLGEPGDQQFPPSLFSIYGYLDDRDQVHIVSETKEIITLQVAGPPSSPEFKPLNDGYDLRQLVEETDDRISGVIMDFQGRYWINMGASSTIYLLDPATAKSPYLDLPHVHLGDGEFTRNGLALTKEGAAYIVTSKKMYRVDVDDDGWPYVVWDQPYETIDKVRPGQYELGSGSTPTVLGNGRYVAITDNAPQMHVMVFRTDEQLDPGEHRIVCQEEVFTFPEGGAGAGSNSLIGLHNSIIVQNTSDYLFDFESAKLVAPGKPGIERIDINPNGKGCTKVWVNKEVASNACMKLSTRTGLIYTQDRKWDADNGVNAYYWVALDFRTGEVVWEKLAGTGDQFDNFWAPIGVGPNGALYGSVYGGITSIRDTP